MTPAHIEASVLLLRDEICEDESLASYLTRLAALNKVRALGDAFTAIVPQAKRYSSEWFDRLATLTRTSPTSLVQASRLALACRVLHPRVELGVLEIGGTHFPVPHWKSMVLLNKRLTPRTELQFCPDCLREQAYHRLPWQVKLNCYCTVHRALLISRCPGCKQQVSIDSVIRCRCQECGASLSAAQTAYLGNDSLAHQAHLLLNSWLHGSTQGLRVASCYLPTDNIRVLWSLVAGLAHVVGRFESDQLSMYRSTWELPDGLRSDPEVPQLIVRFDQVTTAIRAISDWPNSFSDFLLQVREKSDSSGHRLELGVDFPSLYSNYLEREWLFPEFDAVQRAFDGFLETHYQYQRSVEHTRRYREDPSFRSRFKYISMQEAAFRMGVSMDEIELLVRQRALMFQFRHYYSGQVGYWLLPEAVDYLASEFEGTFNVSRAAAVLGISEEMIEELADLGLLERDAPAEDSLGVCLTGRSVWRFRYRFQSAQKRFEGPMMPLEEAVRHLAHRGWNSARVLKAILEGHLRCVYGGATISKAYVSQEDVSELMTGAARHYLNELMAPVAASFGVDPSLVLRWHQLGLLTEDKTLDGLRNLTDADLANFHKKYILYGEALSVLGITPSSMETWINKGRFAEVGYREHRVHSGVFRRADIERFAPGRTLTTSKIAREYRVDKQVLSSWIASGGLRPITGPGVDRCAHHRFAREDVERLVDQSRVPTTDDQS